MSANPGAKTDGGLLFRKRSPPQMRGNLQSQNGPCTTKAGARVNGVAKSTMGQLAGGQAGLSAERSDVSQSSKSQPHRIAKPSQENPLPMGKGKSSWIFAKMVKMPRAEISEKFERSGRVFFPLVVPEIESEHAAHCVVHFFVPFGAHPRKKRRPAAAKLSAQNTDLKKTAPQAKNLVFRKTLFRSHFCSLLASFLKPCCLKFA